MQRLNFQQINTELENLPLDANVELFVFSTIDSLKFHYICSAVDAIFILDLFKDDYEFSYYPILL